MQTYCVEINTEPSNSFRSKLAAQSVDLNLAEKLSHSLKVSAKLPDGYKVGLILGPSGSGKTTLAKKMFGDDCFDDLLDCNKAVIDQFDGVKEYSDVVKILNGVGLSQIPCWLKKPYELSNGQRARASIAVNFANSEKKTIVIDEWTSVVDRTVAKAMSTSIARLLRSGDSNKQVVLVSCHYDIIEWVDPDWIIDCRSQSFLDRTKLTLEERKKKEQLQFNVFRDSGNSWGEFAKYHYLSKAKPCGKNYSFVLRDTHGMKVGFCNFMNYVPKRKGRDFIFHANRIVIHPDYVGFGLGLKMTNLSADMVRKMHPRSKIYIKFSSKPMLRACMKDPKWRFVKEENNLKLAKSTLGRFAQSIKKSGLRYKVKTFTFSYIGK